MGDHVVTILWLSYDQHDRWQGQQGRCLVHLLGQQGGKGIKADVLCTCMGSKAARPAGCVPRAIVRGGGRMPRELDGQQGQQNVCA
eukprot:1136816-Pelagomonas_calceolata.AAC.7